MVTPNSNIQKILYRFYQTKFNPSSIAGKEERVDSYLHEFCERESKRLYQDIRVSSTETLREINQIRHPFETRLNERWGKPLDLLETFILTSTAIGSYFNEKYRAKAAEEKDLEFDVITRLYGKACLIACEILVLLRSGYAAGAEARWRSMHETAVTSRFIVKKGGDTAKRYLDYEVIESCKALEDYNKYAAKLGYEPIHEEDRVSMHDMKDSLIEKYGKLFGADYGWAASILKKRVTFRDIEEAVQMDHYRPYYRMASHHVHSSAKGILFNIGLLHNSDRLILSGPTNAGLADPGHSTALSLSQATITLLSIRISPHNIALLRLIAKFSKEIGEVFLAVHEEQVTEEKAKGMKLK